MSAVKKNNVYKITGATPLPKGQKRAKVLNELIEALKKEGFALHDCLLGHYIFNYIFGTKIICIVLGESEGGSVEIPFRISGHPSISGDIDVYIDWLRKFAIEGGLPYDNILKY